MSELWRVDERVETHENGQTRPTGVVAYVVVVVVPVARRFFKDFRPGSRPSGERRSARPPTRRPPLLSFFLLCRSPRKRGGGPRVLGRAARLTEGPLKPRSGHHLSLSHREQREAARDGREIHTETFRERSLRERGEKNDYPERWITWLVGR